MRLIPGNPQIKTLHDMLACVTQKQPAACSLLGFRGGRAAVAGPGKGYKDPTETRAALPLPTCILCTSLLPLPFLHSPWSHLSIDAVADLATPLLNPVWTNLRSTSLRPRFGILVIRPPSAPISTLLALALSFSKSRRLSRSTERIRSTSTLSWAPISG
jgi:hypothetical protein